MFGPQEQAIRRSFDSFLTHVHPLDVPFGGYDICPNFLPLILGRVLTIIDDR